VRMLGYGRDYEKLNGDQESSVAVNQGAPAPPACPRARVGACERAGGPGVAPAFDRRRWVDARRDGESYDGVIS